MKPLPHNSVVARQFTTAFTLLELLVVIAVIGIVAAMSLPALNNMKKSDAAAAATRQMLDDVARARQFAISQRTTVHMVFVPYEFWNSAGYGKASPNFNVRERVEVTNMLARQMIGYNFLTLREVGDQPGAYRPRFLAEWRTLPEGMFIQTNKFALIGDGRVVSTIYDPPRPAATTIASYVIRDFDMMQVPFPLADSTYSLRMPYIAFNYLGQMVTDRDEEFIPLARGRVSPPLNVNKQPYFGMPELKEVPESNSFNAFNLVVIEKLTGRAHIERQSIQ